MVTSINMSLFPKYIPVTNEPIIQGDIWALKSDPSVKMRAILVGDKIGCDDYKFRPRDREECQKYKLKLCSTDIQPNDRIYSEYRDVLVTEKTDGLLVNEVTFSTYQDIKHLLLPHFKILGDISIDAKWIREDVELAKDEVKLFIRSMSYDDADEPTPENSLYKIRFTDGEFY